LDLAAVNTKKATHYSNNTQQKVGIDSIS